MISTTVGRTAEGGKTGRRTDMASARGRRDRVNTLGRGTRVSKSAASTRGRAGTRSRARGRRGSDTGWALRRRDDGCTGGNGRRDSRDATGCGRVRTQAPSTRVPGRRACRMDTGWRATRTEVRASFIQSLLFLLLSYISWYHIVKSVCWSHALANGPTLKRPASDGGLCSGQLLMM